MRVEIMHDPYEEAMQIDSPAWAKGDDCDAVILQIGCQGEGLCTSRTCLIQECVALGTKGVASSM